MIDRKIQIAVTIWEIFLLTVPVDFLEFWFIVYICWQICSRSCVTPVVTWSVSGLTSTYEIS